MPIMENKKLNKGEKSFTPKNEIPKAYQRMKNEPWEAHRPKNQNLICPADPSRVAKIGRTYANDKAGSPQIDIHEDSLLGRALNFAISKQECTRINIQLIQTRAFVAAFWQPYRPG